MLISQRGFCLDTRILSAFALYSFLILGVFLLVAPWTPIWEQATMSLLPTALGEWATGGWIRGMVSAIGALDLVVAAQVAGGLLGRSRPGAGTRPDHS